MGCVYVVTNRKSGKQYIGKTIHDMTLRWWQHCYDAFHGSTTLLHKAIRKHGIDSFTIAELFEGNDDAVLFECEQRLIAALNTNVCTGGDGPRGSHR